MRAWLLLAAAAAALAVPPLQTLVLLGGDFTEYLDHESLPGQAVYVLAKLVALYSLTLMWMQLMLGLLKHRLIGPLFASPSQWQAAHRFLGAAVLAGVVLHVGLFIAATTLRNGEFAADLLWPSLHGYYRTMVSAGLIAFWLMLVAVAAQVAGLGSARVRRAAHRLVFAALLLAGLHSLAIGSETRAGWMLWMYWAIGLTLAGAAADRLRHGVRATASA
ncbi:MAG: hypothetical protein EPO01_13485 [Aquabacterium sp.]|nr:MAG: hypothetical protein EPO01_13485 [Aquabacterium sp.]